LIFYFFFSLSPSTLGPSFLPRIAVEIEMKEEELADGKTLGWRSFEKFAQNCQRTTENELGKC
jgi:hypothetical protein